MLLGQSLAIKAVVVILALLVSLLYGEGRARSDASLCSVYSLRLVLSGCCLMHC